MTEKTGTELKGVAKDIAYKKKQQLLLDPYGLFRPERKLMMWKDFMEEFLTCVGSRNRSGTQMAYRISLNHFTRVAKSKHVHEINSVLLHDFVLHRCGKKVSAATVNKDLRAVRASLKWADERHYIAACPTFRGVFLREDVKTPIVLSVNHRKAMFAALDDKELGLTVRSADWWRVFIELIAELGVRRGEALGLTWGAVDFERCELSVYSETSKGRRDRTLPLSESLVDLLSAWRQAASTEPGPDGLVLVGLTLGKEYIQGVLRRLEADHRSCGPTEGHETGAEELSLDMW
jgi:integrase